MAPRKAVSIFIPLFLLSGCGEEQISHWASFADVPDGEDALDAQIAENSLGLRESYIEAFLESARQSESSNAKFSRVRENRKNNVGDSLSPIWALAETKTGPRSGRTSPSEMTVSNSIYPQDRTANNSNQTILNANKGAKTERSEAMRDHWTINFEMPKFGVSFAKSISRTNNSPHGELASSAPVFPPRSSELAADSQVRSVTSIQPIFRPSNKAKNITVSNSEFSEESVTSTADKRPKLAAGPETGSGENALGFIQRIFGLSSTNNRKTRTNLASSSDFRSEEIGMAKTNRSSSNQIVEPLPPPKRFDQMECLANALYFEARGEEANGQRAVAEVIMNRVNSKRYPNSICSVVRQGNGTKHSCQFSFYCDGLPERIHESRAYDEAWRLAVQFLSDSDKQLTKGATHFHSVDVNPHWASKFEETARIGRHVFFRDEL